LLALRYARRYRLLDWFDDDFADWFAQFHPYHPIPASTSSISRLIV